MELFNDKGVGASRIAKGEYRHDYSHRQTVVYAYKRDQVTFERDCLAERTKEGLAAARARGRKGGRPKKSSSIIEKAIKLYNSKEYSIAEIKELTGVSRSTLYRYINGG